MLCLHVCCLTFVITSYVTALYDKQEFREVCDKRKKGTDKLPSLPIQVRITVYTTLHDMFELCI
jgi:hypothetical protein